MSRLHCWIRQRDYAGYEPYDLLNSPYLSGGWAYRPPFSYALIQFGKRFGGSRLRRWLRIPPSKNPKALGLVLASLCDLQKARGDFAEEAQKVKGELKRLRSPREPEFCWGYDWNYMALRGTKLPAFSPNCIATYFCGTALLDLAETMRDDEARAMAESVGRFIATRLPRSVDTEKDLCISYVPDDRTLIFNNSALAGAFLARLWKLGGPAEYAALAQRTMHYLVSQQLPEGGWYYGAKRRQRWIDGFHTSYNLCALLDYQNFTGDRAFDENIQRGHAYYKKQFFTDEGAPKYFDRQLYPIDIHSCSQAILHFCAFAEEDPEGLARAEASFEWTQRHMAAADGTYFYQRHRTWVNRTAYMRWGQAWMLRALARLSYLLRKASAPVSVNAGAVREA